MIVFIDMLCPKPYDSKTMDVEALGGTEATVVRIAEALGKTTDVVVLQHNRADMRGGYSNVMYMPLDAMNSIAYPKAVVVLRSPLALPIAREKWPNAKHILWCHDLATKDLLLNSHIINAMPTTILGVSKFHLINLTDLLLCNLEDNARNNIKVKYIHNPIADDLRPDDTVRDPYKLFFASSPHKGLRGTLDCFKLLRERDPKYKLYVSNPGYMPLNALTMDGVYSLGELKHSDVIHHMRTSSMLFYPNTVFPETFGLVFAEANATGTRVLTHDHGAAREILGNSGQTMSCIDKYSVVDTVIAWQQNSPMIDTALAKFRLSHIVPRWQRLLNGEY